MRFWRRRFNFPSFWAPRGREALRPVLKASRRKKKKSSRPKSSRAKQASQRSPAMPSHCLMS